MRRLDKQQETFGDTVYAHDLSSMDRCIRNKEFALAFKGDDGLLPYFHTMDEKGNPTGPLMDLIIQDEDAGGDPRWNYRCTLKARRACSAQPGEEAAAHGSQPSYVAAKTTFPFPAKAPNPPAFWGHMNKDSLYDMYDAMNTTTEKKQKEQLFACIKEYKGDR